MVDTFQGILVVGLALLPGALYVWSFERVVGHWGMGLSDRILRFIGGSAIFHAAIAPVTYSIWRNFVVTKKVQEGAALPWWMWGLLIGYVAVPILAGTLVGQGIRAGKSWAQVVAGPDPAPRAWDHFFSSRPKGWMRLKLKSGPWIGGAYISERGDPLRSYVAGYPYPQDIYLSETAKVDPFEGKFILNTDGDPQLLGIGILVRWEEVEYLAFEDGGSNGKIK